MRGLLAMVCLWGLGAEAPPDPPALREARLRMVETQIRARGVTDPRVLAALTAVPRHAFLPADQRARAYDDTPLPIGHGQTLSQPYVVAVMTAALDLRPGVRILEVGTGSGYQAAVLAELGAEVFTVELVAPLAARAARDLARLGYGRVQVRCADGHLGWPEAAPFDGILVACAPEAIPQALLDQLKPGGRLVIPVGPTGGAQELLQVVKGPEGLVRRRLLPVRFVPMVRP